MRFLKTLIAAGAFAAASLGAGAALADPDHRRDRHDRHDDRHRPERCDHDHDHRAHDVDYYVYFGPDRYSRAGPYRGYDRHHPPHRGSRVVNRQVFDTRYRARIVLVEEEIYSRYGRERVCTVSVKGPDAHYVPDRRVRRIAYDHCSRRSQVRIYA